MKNSKEWRADLARCAFPSQNVQSAPCLDHFFESSDVQKMLRRCGSEHICKPSRNVMLGALLQVQMSKHGALLWREAHVEVQMPKNGTQLWREVPAVLGHFWRDR